MDSSKYKAAMPYLSREEQELLLQLGQTTGEEGVTVALDMDIRHGLAKALGDMGNAVQMLLTLIHRNSLELRQTDMPSYERLLEGISTAAMSGATWVNKSHEFDQSALLALSPEPTAWVQ